MTSVIYGEDVIQPIIDKYQHFAGTPQLAIIRVGENQSVVSYEKSIIKNFKNIGIQSHAITFTEDIQQEEFNQTFDSVNQDEKIVAIILLKPLPPHLDLNYVVDQINPDKDVDCIGEKNMSAIYQGKSDSFIPCTAEAVLKIIEYLNVDIQGKKVAIVGFGMVIGRPLTLLMLDRGSTVKVCHEYTEDLAGETRNADIIIVATGVINLIGANHVKEGAIVIDVGINVNDNQKIQGDVNFEEVVDKVHAITPVPGGVGTVTTYVLADHVFKAYKKHNN